MMLCDGLSVSVKVQVSVGKTREVSGALVELLLDQFVVDT